MGAVTEETVPNAVPLTVARIGGRMIAALPAEPTVEVGRRVQDAVMATASGIGVEQVIVAGYTNVYLSTLTTPEEYERQHYEGGSTLYGAYAGMLLTDGLAELAAQMARGEPAPSRTRSIRVTESSPTVSRFPTARRVRPLSASPRERRRGAAPSPSPGEAGHSATTARSTGPSSSSSGAAATGAGAGSPTTWQRRSSGGSTTRTATRPPGPARGGRHRIRIAARKYRLSRQTVRGSARAV